MQEVHQSIAVWQLIERIVWGLEIVFGFAFGVAFSILWAIVIKVFAGKKERKTDAIKKDKKLKTTAEPMQDAVACQQCNVFFRCFSLN
jgi:hypothetical protein